MDLFAVDSSVEVQEDKDTVGGFAPWESNLYKAVLKTAFLDDFAKGSKNITLVVEITNEAGEVRTITEKETVWSMKTQGPYYLDKKTGAKKQLIGKSKMDALAMLLTGKNLQTSTWEEKVHKIRKDGAEVPTARQTLTEWTNTPIYVGVQKVAENKTIKQGDAYVPIADIREFNTMDKFFNSDKKTLTEVKTDKPAEFFEDWLKANEGKTKDKTNKNIAAAPASGVPSATAAPLIL